MGLILCCRIWLGIVDVFQDNMQQLTQNINGYGNTLNDQGAPLVVHLLS